MGFFEVCRMKRRPKPIEAFDGFCFGKRIISIHISMFVVCSDWLAMINVLIEFHLTGIDYARHSHMSMRS